MKSNSQDKVESKSKENANDLSDNNQLESKGAEEKLESKAHDSEQSNRNSSAVKSKN